MSQETLLVCILCKSSQAEERQAGLSEGQFLFNQLQDGLETSSEASIRLQPVRCMGACDRACVVVFMAPNKLTFILSQLSPSNSVPDLLEFSRQYREHPTLALSRNTQARVMVEIGTSQP